MRTFHASVRYRSLGHDPIEKQRDLHMRQSPHLSWLTPPRLETSATIHFIHATLVIR